MGTGIVGTERTGGVVAALAAAGWLAAFATPAAAQEPEQSIDEDFELEEEAVDQDVTDASAAETGEDVDLMDDDAMGADRVDDEQVLLEERAGVETVRSTIDPYEAQDTDYFFLGALFRQTFQPEWMLNWFFEKSTGTDNAGGGLEFTWRRNSFSLVIQSWYQLARTEGSYQQLGDPLDEIEWIQSDLSLLFVSATFLWATDFTDWFAIEYGFGVGLGAVFGNLTRTEAYPTNALDEAGNPRNPAPPPRDPYAPCTGLGQPIPDGIGPAWCDGIERDDPGNFQRVEERWSDGGGVPNIYPWLALPHIALRFKPIKQIMIRIDGGFSTAGPFVGGTLAYGF